MNNWLDGDRNPMSMFLCPLCGKQNSIRNYHPETFEDDVEVFHNVGRGRGKGLEKITGYDIEEFPELRQQIEDRVRRISEFLGLSTEQDVVAMERMRREEAEDQLEELDIDVLLHRLNEALGRGYTDVHQAADELISRYSECRALNRKLEAKNTEAVAANLSLHKENNSLLSERNRLQHENNNLIKFNKQWAQTYKALESESKQMVLEYQKAYTIEHERRVAAEENLEELDLDALLGTINKNRSENYSNIHAAVNGLIHEISEIEDEHKEVLDGINNTLPDEYDEYSDLGEAVDALIQYYEDQVEELSDV